MEDMDDLESELPSYTFEIFKGRKGDGDPFSRQCRLNSDLNIKFSGLFRSC